MQCQRNGWSRYKRSLGLDQERLVGERFWGSTTHVPSPFYSSYQSLQEMIQSDPGWQNHLSWVSTTASNDALRYKTLSTARAELCLQSCLSKHGTFQVFACFSKCTHGQDGLQPSIPHIPHLTQMFTSCMNYADRKIWIHLVLHFHLSSRHLRGPYGHSLTRGSAVILHLLWMRNIHPAAVGATHSPHAKRLVYWVLSAGFCLFVFSVKLC